MFSMRLDGRKGEKRLKRLLSDVVAWSGHHAEVTPTQPILEISRLRGQTLLATRDDRTAAQTYRRLTRKGGALLEAFAKGKTVSAERIASFWRYAAYVYLERTAWPAARDGVWGNVQPETVPRKQRDLTAAREFRDEQRELHGRAQGLLNPDARGRRNRRTGEVSVPWSLRSFGVRAPETARRWYHAQKGKGGRHLRDDREPVGQPVRVVKRPIP